MGVPHRWGNTPGDDAGREGRPEVTELLVASEVAAADVPADPPAAHLPITGVHPREWPNGNG